ncbi:MAG: Diguanylate cyclase DosC [Deltaproteobacteria bacterium ADurb.Bin072]|nr:MAG: Diguanylate cyclase DosC [Deltaproteobacteria bacterium ADurb.Bin072]
MWHIIPHDDHNQSLRIKRFLIACASYLMWILLIWYCSIQGMIRLGPKEILLVFAMVLVMNLVLYAIFRTGLNRRLKDPSLTMVQMSLATAWIMIVAYNLNEARGIMLQLYLVVFIFGAFRLNLRQFIMLSILAALSYGLVILSLLENHPETVNFKVELLYLVILTAVLFWFSFVGSYINTLRKKLSRANSELNHAVEIIRQKAIRDDLTDVYTRGYLFQILAREKSLADREGLIFSVCIFDLDDFKKVNDSFGHHVGDMVLKTLSGIIRDNIRQQDYIARYGGEEFVLVLAYPDMHDALACVERIRTLISEASFPGLPVDYPVTVSMGLTRYQPEETIDSLLIRADDALYRAKRSGKNATACEPSSLLEPAA